MSQNTIITLSKGGTNEQLLRLGDIDIPDTYNHAATIRKRRNFHTPQRAADQIMTCWILCHALYDYIYDQPD